MYALPLEDIKISPEKNGWVKANSEAYISKKCMIQLYTWKNVLKFWHLLHACSILYYLHMCIQG